MKAELIAVGSELVRLGRPDTNGDWLVERLNRIGVEVAARVVIEDDVERIASQVRASLARSDVIVMSGGLGTTCDDLTRLAVAKALDRPLERDEGRERTIRKRLEGLGRSAGAEQGRQADRPRGSSWIDSPFGTAPGFLVERDDALLFALPGVPEEMKAMFRETVAPRLGSPAGRRSLRRTLKVAGLPESDVDRSIAGLDGELGVELTVLCAADGVELHVRSSGRDEREARARLDAYQRGAGERLGANLYGTDDDTLASVVGGLALRKGWTIATAESCTAGALGAAITSVPGSSGWYRGGFVLYDDEMKRRLVGVSESTLAEHGAVSEAVARALARGARERCDADLGVGITGIAGPDGGTPDKPVGLVHLALADRREEGHWTLRTLGDRATVRRRAVAAAMDRLRRRLEAAG